MILLQGYRVIFCKNTQQECKSTILNVVYKAPVGIRLIAKTFVRYFVKKLWQSLILAGDFNVKLVDFESNKKDRNFENLLLKFIKQTNQISSYRVINVRDGSRAAATSNMEHFVIIVNVLNVRRGRFN